MAFLDHSQIARTNDRAAAARGKELFAGILIVALMRPSVSELDQMVRLFTLSNQAE